MSAEVAGLDWSEKRLIPSFMPVQHLDVYDLRGASRDVQLAFATGAGIVNRPRPRCYLIGEDVDAFWLQQLATSYPQTYVEQKGDTALQVFLEREHAAFQGIIIYDPALPDTINVATTLAGQRDAIVLSPALTQDVQERFDLPVLVDLRRFGWRNPVQAYTWAMRYALDGSSPRLLAGIRPSIMGFLRSYLVATRTFTYWLDASSRLPALRSRQSSERALVRRLYATFASDATHLGWFPDEPAAVALLSQLGIPVLASDFCPNLEVWTALQPAPTTTTSPARDMSDNPVPDPEPGKVYVAFTLSDGDNLQYCRHRMHRLWHDAARGSLPLGWTIAPSLPQIMPTLARYYQETATPNDELIGGPSGIAYMFPSYWPASRLAGFLEHTGESLQAMGIQTLEVLDSGVSAGYGLSTLSRFSPAAMAFARAQRRQQFVQALAPYGVRGILTGAGFLLNTTVRWQMVDGIPVYRNLGLVSSSAHTVSLLKAAAATRRRPLFLSVYVEAWKLGPSDLKRIAEQLGSEYKVVLPRTLLAMVAKSAHVKTHTV